MRIRYEYNRYLYSKRATDLDHTMSLFTTLAIPLCLASLISAIVGISEFIDGMRWDDETTKAILWTIASAAFIVLRYTKIKAHIERIAREDQEKFRKGIK